MARWEHSLQDGAEDERPGLEAVFICVSIGLVLLAGLMSGLTLGLMSMDQVDLEVTPRLFGFRTGQVLTYISLAYDEKTFAGSL